MIKLSKWIMSHKVAIVVVFAVLLVLAVVGNFFVDKESDLIAYLADDTDTIVAKSILENNNPRLVYEKLASLLPPRVRKVDA